MPVVDIRNNFLVIESLLAELALRSDNEVIQPKIDWRDECLGPLGPETLINLGTIIDLDVGYAGSPLPRLGTTYDTHSSRQELQALISRLNALADRARALRTAALSDTISRLWFVFPSNYVEELNGLEIRLVPSPYLSLGAYIVRRERKVLILLSSQALVTEQVLAATLLHELLHLMLHPLIVGSKEAINLTELQLANLEEQMVVELCYRLGAGFGTPGPLTAMLQSVQEWDVDIVIRAWRERIAAQATSCSD